MVAAEALEERERDLPPHPLLGQNSDDHPCFNRDPFYFFLRSIVKLIILLSASLK